MPTKLIKLEDGTLVEVEVPEGQAQQISGGFAERVNATFERVKPVMVEICRSVNNAWQEINKDVQIDQAEIELGLSFEGEGNLYITRSKASANLVLKLTLKPKE